MNKHILRYSVVMLFALLLGGCDKFERTEVLPQIYVNKSAINGFIGQEVQLTASPTDGKYSFQWMSEDPGVASVSSNGLVKLLGEGATIVVLSAGDIKQRVQINSAVRVPVADVILSESLLELTPQAKKTIIVQILPQKANDIPTAIWSTDNVNVAVVSERGEITGVSEGTTTVNYKLGDIVRKVTVKVSYTRPFNGPHILQAGAPVDVMAADFDLGGLGRAFNDDAANPVGDAYRRGKGDNNSAAVEIEGPGTNIGYIGNGEWYQYTVEVKDAGNYLVQASLSGTGAGRYHIEVDNVNVTGAVNTVSNGSWSSWVYHPNPALKLNLAQGTRKIKFFIEQSGFNLRALRFTKE